MRFAPWQLFAVMVAGALSQHDQQVIDYLREENRVLREKLGPQREPRSSALPPPPVWRGSVGFKSPC